MGVLQYAHTITMKIALAQINPTIGDFENNLNKILENAERAYKNGAELIIFPELAICGYPPKDLLLKNQFILDNQNYLNLLAEKVNKNISVIVGFAEENKGSGKPLFNSLAYISNKKIITTRQKTLLPTYDVFDEDRYFEPGKENKPVEISGKRAGLTVCEDIWQNDLAWTKPRYHIDPIKTLIEHKIDFLINSAASPYWLGKPKLRQSIFQNCVKKYNVPIIFVNQVGGNDELVFDGNSCVMDQNGNILLKLKSFEEDLQIYEYNNDRRDAPLGHLYSDDMEELFEAIICGLRDYVRKCGFRKVIIGLSGGVDSALVSVLATLALGKENVLCVFMPSRYTADESFNDATMLSKNLETELKTISIEEPFKAILNLLAPHIKNFDGVTHTEENIQPRLRGLILMALSNQTGALVLSTGNKSELATGYCTLYGDMCGGLSVISDLPKTLVYKLAKYINKKYNNVIPENIIHRAPTAELKPNQTDQDTLPPYDILDSVLNMYAEEHMSLKEIVKSGIQKDTVTKVCNMIDSSEYKRKQAAPGLKLTSRSFGYGWRMPIAQRYRETI